MEQSCMKTYRQLQLKHYTVAPCIESQNCYSRKLHSYLALPIVLKGLSRSVLNGLRSAEFKCSGCFQTLSPSNLKLAPFYVIQKTWWKVSAFGQL